MSAPTVIPPAGGEIIGDTADRRVEVLSDHDSLHATWSRFGPRRDGAGPHIHHHHTDFFYVLSGELTVRLGLEDDHVAVPAGSLVRVPPYVVHGFRNASDEDVTYLNLHAPGCGFIGYMRGLRDRRPVDFDQLDPPKSGVRPASEAVIGEPSSAIDDLVLSEVRHEGGDPERPRLHPRLLASFFVLEGELALMAGSGELHAQAGSWVQVPHGVPHTVGSASPDPVRFLDVLTPAG